MKVLWITNILFPEALAKFSDDGELKSSGGWMVSAACALTGQPNISLYVATVSPLVKELTRVDGGTIIYYIFPYGKGNLRDNIKYQDYWKQINKIVCPDIVHIHGTEFSHGLAYMKACGTHNVVISIQGLKSACAKHYHDGMSKWDIYSNITPRDILRGTILTEKCDFQRSTSYEVEMLRMSKHVIGRTSWDKSKVMAVNSNVEYHFCNETLREEFYEGPQWNYDECSKYTIFLSQAGYPLKGLHQLLKAMPSILAHFPDTKVRIAGHDITKCDNFKDYIHFTGYGQYIKRMIKRLQLSDKITFVGSLNAEEMKTEYLHSNVFLCPSSVENSPNSLAEAQILGVPCVASNVGGIPDMMKDNESNLYEFHDVKMLADRICQIFYNRNMQVSTREIARERHDKMKNTIQLIEIYKSIG
jgi:glycosyltransferase involved in cell wall biosynthesis